MWGPIYGGEFIVSVSELVEGDHCTRILWANLTFGCYKLLPTLQDGAPQS